MKKTANLYSYLNFWDSFLEFLVSYFNAVCSCAM